MQTELVQIRAVSAAKFTFRQSVLPEPSFHDETLLGENRQKLAAHAGKLRAISAPEVLATCWS